MRCMVVPVVMLMVMSAAPVQGDGQTMLKLHGKGWFQFGKMSETLRALKPEYEFSKAWLQSAGAQITFKADIGSSWDAAMGLGGAQGAYEKALKYAQERKQFGKPIARFQAIGFKLADCATEIEAARNLLYKACWLKINGRPYSKLAAMAKLYCSEVMGRVVNHAVQIHGGYGLMQEYDVERFYRDHKLLEIGEGTSEVQRIVISRHIGCR